MIFVLTLFLALLTLALGVWVYRLKQSLKEHFKLERELQYEVGHDALTGLVNASLLIDRLDQSLKNAQRHKQKVAILYLEVDYFKQINTASCFDITNEFLQTLSKKFLECVNTEDTVAHVQGDEFVIVIDHFDKITFIQELIQKIIAISNERLSISHHTIDFTFSIGISLYPNDKVDTISLLNHAYTAMQMIKKSEDSGFKFYTLKLAEQAFKNEKIEYELIEAIKKNEMEVYYQLQFNPLTNAINGVEAYVQWKHPTMGKVPAHEFIVLSEEIGFITAIDRWIITEALSQIEKLHSPLNLSLNVSLLTLRENWFIDEIHKLLDDSSMKDKLVFKIKESEFVKYTQSNIDKLKELSALGIKFSLTASSLKYLKKLPLDEIQVNRNLIINITDNREMVEMIIDIAKKMDIKVVANGVESEEIRDFLLNHNCTKIQGYLYHKPVSLKELKNKLH